MVAGTLFYAFSFFTYYLQVLFFAFLFAFYLTIYFTILYSNLGLRYYFFWFPLQEAFSLKPGELMIPN